MHKKYFPILKAKAGELKAIETLKPNEKNSLSPVIELLPDSYDSVLTRLTASWPFNNNQILIDPAIILETDSDTTELEELYTRLQEQNVNAIPVLRLNSDEDYISLVKDYINEYKSLFCIRITNDYAKPRTFNALIASMIEDLQTSYDRCIILFDLAHSNDDNYQHLSNSAIANIKALKSIESFYQIVTASGSFPKDLSQIPAKSEIQLERIEALIWNQINEEIDYPIFYGDYGIKHPIYDPEVMQFPSTASIKYTTKNSYYIFRGIKPKDHPDGNGQYILHCKSLVTKPEYDSPTFSWADNEINTYALKAVTDKPGNAETWVRIGHSRHISKLLTLL
ncbi:beta family protein [Chitinophaga filiformis]|uniref:Beta family protein n=1 Tax=Chitinophaga filiformis TaxID=104663 RepID=A0ABY4I5R0_CHIFI|nr:beta family protein [Chitinophaga filiformis]UPK71421.1 beta family protein [Chitinophaga filiformis]